MTICVGVSHVKIVFTNYIDMVSFQAIQMFPQE
jgi:hypothetical protein